MTACFETFDDIFDFAIQREQAASAFYASLAADARNPAMKKAFMEFAGEERGHGLRLERVKAARKALPRREEVLNLQIARYLVSGEGHGRKIGHPRIGG